MGFGKDVLITNKKEFPNEYKYVLKSVGNKITSSTPLKWERFNYKLEETKNIKDTWNNNIFIKQEILENNRIKEQGLRKPQIGALYAALSNWTVDESERSNIIVMPTGTGKTETMLLLLLAGKCDKILVIVPSTALREQISNKFINLGILKKNRNNK